MIHPLNQPTAKNMVPYDTGKVKIGLTYSPPIRYESSHDEDMLQEALLMPSKQPLWSRLLRLWRDA